jgi:regulator of sigma E protease
MVLAIIAIMLTLLLVIGIHEAGHALVAYLFKIKIKRIAIGFGKPLIQWRSKTGCEWVLGMWFLGGYVHLNNTRINPVAPNEYSTCFDKKAIWQRVLVLLAGIAANIITAWLAFIFVFYVGIHYRLPQINTVVPNSVASKAGILPQEHFISIRGHQTPSWQDVGQELIILWGSKDISVSLKTASGLTKDVTLDLSQIKFNSTTRSLLASLGVNPNLKAPYQKMQASTFFEAVAKANHTIAYLIYFYVLILKQLFTGVIPFSLLLGPVGLFAASIASLTQGVVVFFYFIASLSVAVALINLFPIPGLDGGSILYAIIEKIRGKPLSVALEILIYRLMLIALSLVFVQLVLNDLAHFIH